MSSVDSAHAPAPPSWHVSLFSPESSPQQSAEQSPALAPLQSSPPIPNLFEPAHSPHVLELVSGSYVVESQLSKPPHASPESTA